MGAAGVGSAYLQSSPSGTSSLAHRRDRSARGPPSCPPCPAGCPFSAAGRPPLTCPACPAAPSQPRQPLCISVSLGYSGLAVCQHPALTVFLLTVTENIRANVVCAHFYFPMCTVYCNLTYFTYMEGITTIMEKYHGRVVTTREKKCESQFQA